MLGCASSTLPTAATANAFGDFAGYLTASPELPAATMQATPALTAAIRVSSTTGLISSSPPRLMLTTSIW